MLPIAFFRKPSYAASWSFFVDAILLCSVMSLYESFYIHRKMEHAVCVYRIDFVRQETIFYCSVVKSTRGYISEQSSVRAQGVN
jgi:hypothetical protein